MANHAVLTAEAHRDLRIRTDTGAALGDGVMACLTVPEEFRRVQVEFPILFRLNDTRDRFSALALFGFENGENLFLEGARWTADYRPLALAIQPLLIGGAAPGAPMDQVHIDLDSPRIATGADEGVRLFDDDGRPSPFLDTAVEKLSQLHHGHQASDAFFAALQRYELLEPMTLEITLDDGSTNRLVGFHIIDEAKLQALDGAALADLHGAGHLLPIFMAVASLGKLETLIARKNRRLAHG